MLQPWHRIHALSKRMAAKKGISVFIISNKTSNSCEIEEIDGIVVTRISRLTLVGICGKKKLAEAVLKNKPDVVVWYGSPLSVMYLNQLRTIGKPIIWDVDMDIPSLKTLSRLSRRELLSPDHNMFLQIMTAIYPKFVIKRIANSGLISRIVVPSQSLKNSLNRVGVYREKIMVIPSTIEDREYDSFGRKEKLTQSSKDSGQKEFIVTYFGSPCTLRGTDTAILSMQKVLEHRRNVTLVILSRHGMSKTLARANYPSSKGDYFEDRHLRSEEDYLKKLTRRLGVDNNVQILSGIMDKTELIKHLLASDVVVLPFKVVKSEPPLSVLEAMNLGKVVVTTNLSSLSEIVSGGRGMLIEPGDVQALTLAILYLTTHRKEAVGIGNRAKDFTVSLCDWDQLALRFEELVRDVALAGDDGD